MAINPSSNSSSQRSSDISIYHNAPLSPASNQPEHSLQSAPVRQASIEAFVSNARATVYFDARADLPTITAASRSTSGGPVNDEVSTRLSTRGQRCDTVYFDLEPAPQEHRDAADAKQKSAKLLEALPERGDLEIEFDKRTDGIEALRKMLFERPHAPLPDECDAVVNLAKLIGWTLEFKAVNAGSRRTEFGAADCRALQRQAWGVTHDWLKRYSHSLDAAQRNALCATLLDCVRLDRVSPDVRREAFQWAFEHLIPAEGELQAGTSVCTTEQLTLILDGFPTFLDTRGGLDAAETTRLQTRLLRALDSKTGLSHEESCNLSIRMLQCACSNSLDSAIRRELVDMASMPLFTQLDWRLLRGLAEALPKLPGIGLWSETLDMIQQGLAIAPLEEHVAIRDAVIEALFLPGGLSERPFLQKTLHDFISPVFSELPPDNRERALTRAMAGAWNGLPPELKTQVLTKAMQARLPALALLTPAGSATVTDVVNAAILRFSDQDLDPQFQGQISSWLQKEISSLAPAARGGALERFLTQSVKLKDDTAKEVAAEFGKRYKEDSSSSSVTQRISRRLSNFIPVGTSRRRPSLNTPETLPTAEAPPLALTSTAKLALQSLEAAASVLESSMGLSAGGTIHGAAMDFELFQQELVNAWGSFTPEECEKWMGIDQIASAVKSIPRGADEVCRRVARALSKYLQPHDTAVEVLKRSLQELWGTFPPPQSMPR